MAFISMADPVCVFKDFEGMAVVIGDGFFSINTEKIKKIPDLIKFISENKDNIKDFILDKNLLPEGSEETIKYIQFEMDHTMPYKDAEKKPYKEYKHILSKGVRKVNKAIKKEFGVSKEKDGTWWDDSYSRVYRPCGMTPFFAIRIDKEFTLKF